MPRSRQPSTKFSQQQPASKASVSSSASTLASDSASSAAVQQRTRNPATPHAGRTLCRQAKHEDQSVGEQASEPAGVSLQRYTSHIASQPGQDVIMRFLSSTTVPTSPYRASPAASLQSRQAANAGAHIQCKLVTSVHILQSIRMPYLHVQHSTATQSIQKYSLLVAAATS
jgi:hypothetical protein